MLIKKENIANYSKLGPWTPEEVSDPNPPVSIPDLNSVPANYESLIGDTLDAAGREKTLSNKEALNFIENRAKALEQKLPTVDSDIIKQLSFSGDTSKLRDCMVIVLYSPSSNENPNLSNSPQELNRKGAELVTEAGKKVGELIDGLTEPEITEKSSALDKAKKRGVGLLKSSKQAIQNFDKTKEFTSNNIESLNTNFYTEGDINSPNKKKTIFLPLPKQINDIHSHNVDAFSNNPIAPIAGVVSGILNAITGPLSGTPSSRAGIGKVSMPGVAEFFANNAQLATRKTFNPATETLYRSPNLRNWQWNIEFQPTSKEEADQFLRIVEILKQHSYPTQDLGGILYTFPGTVDFYFRINGEESKVLPKSLQKCFLKSVQLDYTQQGFYAHFKDGNPVVITLTLDIAETRLLDRNDLENALSYNNADLQQSLEATGLTREQILKPYKSSLSSGRPD
jgi:hypothetical protein